MLLVEGKVRKFGLKLRIEKTKMAMHIWQQEVLESCKNMLFQINFLKEPGKQGLPLKSGLISVQSGLAKNKGWDKPGTTNYIYLSAPEVLF